MEAGKVTPVIGRRYPLSEVPQAMRYMEEGHARGKVVITVYGVAAMVGEVGPHNPRMTLPSGTQGTAQLMMNRA